MHFVETIRFRRGKLPHWEVTGGRYFITLRLADSLPRAAVLRLKEIHATLAAIEPQSEQFIALQRRHFLSMEKYLDAGTGNCALGHPVVAERFITELRSLSEWHVTVPHFTVMPNHCHLLLIPAADCSHPLADIMKRLKGRTAQCIRKVTASDSAVWQREWFDRWLRTDFEYEKTIAYIRQNPVKAGLVKAWSEHPWTQ